MKSLSALFFVPSLILAAATTSARAQDVIPNGNFETWSAGEPADWSSSAGCCPGSIVQSSDAHSGSWALQGNVVELFPGFYGPAFFQSPGYPDFPVTQRWGSLKGYYKLNSVNADALVITVVMFKNSNPVGVGAFIDSVSTSTYTEFTAPIAYYDGTTPDSAFIDVTMGPGEGAPAMHPGSWYKVDDFVFSPDSGFSECPVAVSGDATGDGEVKSSDIIYLVNYVLKAGPAPVPCEAAGDANGDGEVKSSDIIYEVNYVLKGGPAPEDICAQIPGIWSCP